MNCFKIIFITFIIIFFSTLFSFGSMDSHIISDIDTMVSLVGTKADIQTYIDRIVKYGEPAVKHLINKYDKVEDEKRWPIVVCLCKIPTNTSVNLLKDILKQHSTRYSTTATIRNFPIEYEDDILTILIDLLTAQLFRWDTTERLKEMIERKSVRAGSLIGELKDDISYEERNNQLYEVLEYVSGYSHWGWFESRLQPRSRTDQVLLRNNFWREWWQRNKDKNQVEWLLEPLSSKSSWRKAQACQILGSLENSKAIPYLLKLLDDDSQEVRYWAVVGLKALNNTNPPSGYLFETFEKEESEEIKKLKEYFKDK